MGARAGYHTGFAQVHRSAEVHSANRVRVEQPSPIGEATEAEIDMGRSATAQMRGAMRRMLAAFHLSGAARPAFAPPRRSVDRELQERWPSYE
ncbi:MAG: hypothetical protein ACREQB_07455 [Candidatus Binataceae bacterium]